MEADNATAQPFVRYTVHFSGRVQGVGFRYNTVVIAEEYRVAGFVQNMPDGRVLLVVEGRSEELDAFVDQVARQMGRHIRAHSIDKGPATGVFGTPGIGGFEVRY